MPPSRRRLDTAWANAGGQGDGGGLRLEHEFGGQRPRAFSLTLIEGRVTRGVFAEFPERLLRGMDRKVFLLVDGDPTHKARSVQRFVEAHAERMELFFVPPYGSELNPDELPWAHVKSRVARAVSRTNDGLKKMVRSVQRRPQRRREIVRSLFVGGR